MQETRKGEYWALINLKWNYASWRKRLQVAAFWLINILPSGAPPGNWRTLERVKSWRMLVHPRRLTCAGKCACVFVCRCCTQLSCKLQNFRARGVAAWQFICISNVANCGAHDLCMCVCLIMRCNYDVATTRMATTTVTRKTSHEKENKNASELQAALQAASCNIVVAPLQSQQAEQKVCWQPRVQRKKKWRCP